MLYLFFVGLLVFSTTIQSAGYEYGPVEHHLATITFQGRTSDTVAAWQHFKGVFDAYPPSDLYPILDNLLQLRDTAWIERGIAHCACLLFMLPTERCAQVRGTLYSRIEGLNTIIFEADYYIDILESSS